jgi:translation initiation factor 1
MTNSRLVYSTGDGDQRKRGREKPTQASGPDLPRDGVVRVFREQSGRRGKTVTVVRGLPAAKLDEVASDLKRHCGSGGAIKAAAVEIQGDHRDKVVARLRAQGYEVKPAGG